MTSPFPGLNPGDPGYWEVIFDVIPFPVYVADSVTHEVICTNRAMRTKVGVVQGRKCYEAIYQQPGPCSFCRIPEMLEQSGEMQLEFEHFNDRDDRWYQLRETMLTWFDGRRAKHSIAVDISALKGFQNALAEAHAELALKNRDLMKAVSQAREAERAKSEFLAVMSHEIRTPMNSILGMVHLLMDRPLAAEDREKLSVVHDSGTALLGIINDILDFSRLEADGVQFEKSPFHLGRTVEGVVSLLRGRAAEKGLTLGLDATIAPGWVSGDGARLRQVLINLIGNAIKFTTQGGIMLRLTRTGDENRYEFSVVDTGIGLDPAQADGLFRPFHQADASISRRFGGSGLGLAICKKLIEAQGGEIGVDSTRGLGSRFWFRLSLPAADAPVQESGGADHPPLTALSILLAEDNAFNQKVAVGLLDRDGHTVTVAGNGREALERLERGETFDLVLMDMQMPEMDGPEATRLIRALPGPAAAIPIIALTANAMAEDVARCRSAGMDGHVAKPIDPRQLRAVMAEALASRPAAGEDDGESEHSLTRMARQLGNDNAAILARTFIDSVEDICRRLEAVGGDLKTTANAIHELKGLAAYSGTPWLETTALSIGVALCEDDPLQVEALIQRLRRDWDEAKHAIGSQFNLDITP